MFIEKKIKFNKKHKTKLLKLVSKFGNILFIGSSFLILAYFFIYIKGNLFLYDKEYRENINIIMKKAINSYEGEFITKNQKKWKKINFILYDEYKNGIGIHPFKGTMGATFSTIFSDIILINNYFLRQDIEKEKVKNIDKTNIFNTFQHEFMHILQHYSFTKRTYDDLETILKTKSDCYYNNELYKEFKKNMKREVAIKELFAHSLHSSCPSVIDYHRNVLGWWLKDTDFSKKQYKIAKKIGEGIENGTLKLNKQKYNK